MNRFSVAMFKITALFSFCGGPLFVTDQLEPHLTDPYHFVVAFSPVAVMVLGAFALVEREHDLMARICVWSGALGGVALLAMNIYAGWHLATGSAPAERGLLTFGIAVGLVAITLYVKALTRWRGDT